MQELIDIIERGFETGAKMESAAESEQLAAAVQQSQQSNQLQKLQR